MSSNNIEFESALLLGVMSSILLIILASLYPIPSISYLSMQIMYFTATMPALLLAIAAIDFIADVGKLWFDASKNQESIIPEKINHVKNVTPAKKIHHAMNFIKPPVAPKMMKQSSENQSGAAICHHLKHKKENKQGFNLYKVSPKEIEIHQQKAVITHVGAKRLKAFNNDFHK